MRRVCSAHPLTKILVACFIPGSIFYAKYSRTRTGFRGCKWLYTIRARWCYSQYSFKPALEVPGWLDRWTSSYRHSNSSLLALNLRRPRAPDELQIFCTFIQTMYRHIQCTQHATASGFMLIGRSTELKTSLEAGFTTIVPFADMHFRSFGSH